MVPDHIHTRARARAFTHMCVFVTSVCKCVLVTYVAVDVSVLVQAALDLRMQRGAVVVGKGGEANERGVCVAMHLR